MYTSRGFRRASKENSQLSRQGQIIQKKPVYQIDNNPVILAAYKRYILQGKQLLNDSLLHEVYTVTLTDIPLSWTQNSSYSAITEALKEFAKDVFDKLKLQGKYPISLELSQPNLDDTLGWAVMSNSLVLGAVPVYEIFSEIIIDILGNLSYTQYGSNTYAVAQKTGSLGPSTSTIGYVTLSSGGNLMYGNPATMKMDVYYLETYK